MPRDGSGVYSRPPGTDAVADTTIDSAKYNNNVADVEADLNTPRPIVAGGTAATSADAALTNLSAEKAKQIVTNWDATTWRAGSFYAATTATGAAPVAGHAFAGIAYYANATDFVNEAVDLTTPTNPIVYIRVMTAGVWGAWANVGSSAAATAAVSAVRYDITQTLTAAQQLQARNNIGPPGPLAIRTFTVNGTYTPTVGMTSCVIECVGGGGGGGGSPAASGNAYGGGGGGSGSYSRTLATAAQIGASQAIAVGGGGAQSVGNAQAGSGAVSSVGTLCVANGGAGASGVSAGGAGGARGTGDFTAAGAPGGGAYGFSGVQGMTSGFGGSSIFGGGALGAAWSNNTAINGTPASLWGSGGSGSTSLGTAGAAQGGAGSQGIVIITEYR